jgi:hypothetical protein
MRGLRVGGTVRWGGVVMSVPLPLCLQDDEPPVWYCCGSAGRDGNNGEGVLDKGTMAMVAMMMTTWRPGH